MARYTFEQMAANLPKAKDQWKRPLVIPRPFTDEHGRRCIALLEPIHGRAREIMGYHCSVLIDGGEKFGAHIHSVCKDQDQSKEIYLLKARNKAAQIIYHWDGDFLCWPGWSRKLWDDWTTKEKHVTTKRRG